MKNLFFLLTFILFGSLSYGQNINYSLINIEETNKPDFSINSERTISNDTVMDYIARASGMYITGLQDSGVFVGYASGNNPIFSEFGMRITRDLSSTESMNLLACIYIVYKKVGIGSDDNFKITVADINSATNMPITSILSTATVSIASLDTTITTNGINIVEFNDQPSLNAEFSIGFDLTGIDDTVALYTSNPGTNDGQGENRYWFNYGGQYISANVGFGGYDADLLVAPIVQITEDTSNNSGGTGVTEKELFYNTKIYPNPSEGVFQLVSFVSEHNKYELSIYDPSGKLVLSNTYFSSGILNESLDLRNLTPGNYILNISAGEHRFLDKIIVK
jgi:hypothetical protein